MLISNLVFSRSFNLFHLPLCYLGISDLLHSYHWHAGKKRPISSLCVHCKPKCHQNSVCLLIIDTWHHGLGPYDFFCCCFGLCLSSNTVKFTGFYILISLSGHRRKIFAVATVLGDKLQSCGRIVSRSVGRIAGGNFDVASVNWWISSCMVFACWCKTERHFYLCHISVDMLGSRVLYS